MCCITLFLLKGDYFMKPEEVKAITKSVKELTKERIEMNRSVKDTTRDVSASKNLWKSHSQPWLIKTGIGLIAFPEPVVTPVLGSAFLTAGAVQEGIKRQAVYIDDLPKAFNSAMKDLKRTKSLF